MGVVLKAFDPALHRPVAIKVLAPALAGSATARRRFTREAQAAAAVCHDNVVAVHGVSEADGLPYLVMQYVAGESLQARLDRTGPLEVAEAVRIGLQAARGLAAAHAQGLIHRDVKPANLLLEDGLARVKITDFGLARMADDAGLTRAGVVAGTPEYMAPEQARGEQVDHRADLFSLGSVLYACCTGRPPFRGPTPLAVLRQVSDEAPTPIRSLNPEVPAWLEALIVRLMAKDPDQRIQTAAELATLLEGYLAHLQQPTRGTAPDLPPLRGQGQGMADTKSLRRVHRTASLVAGAALLLLLAVLLVATHLGSPAGNDPPKGAQEADRAKPARGHMVFDFRARIDTFPALTLEGPDAEAVARTDAQGLRVTIPADRGDTSPVSVVLGRRLRGDFDIALGYELLAVGDPAPEYGAGVVLRVLFDEPSSLSAILSRSRKPGRETFGAHRVLKGPDGKEKYFNNVEAKATAPRGTLRLARTGSQLRYLVAEEGQDSTTLESVDVGTADVQMVWLRCTTMYKPIALDVRLTNLVIDADEFPDGVPSSQAPDVAPPPPTPAQTGDKGWFLAGAIVGGATAATVLVAVWLAVRHGRRPRKVPARATEPRPVSVPCPGCGKALKARPELAGKKVKCPQCGQALLVPGPEAGNPGGTPS
jgi:hypothetical protein